MSRTFLPLLLVLLPALPLPAAAPPLPSLTVHGDRLRDAWFRKQAQQLADNALADIRTKADWEKARPELRRQLLDMLGLWPMPERTDLKVQVTGTLDGPHFTIEKLLFQSSPGLYVTGNLYVPKKVKLPAPAVLYVCGHGSSNIGGVAFGNKVPYQHHAAWFAENGYVCLIIDTLQLGEIAGLHHGTHRFDMWWWQALGYTPAGIEAWNATRAIDYLVSRREVDPKRIGVTGRSGGGATSWWVAALDERVQCAVPVAGIADMLAHVSEGYPGSLRDGVIAGHCDCMYFVNTYRWDFTQVMALCAPRAVLLGNSDRDNIFPVPGYQRMAGKVRRLYQVLGAGEKFDLLETKGPHLDTPELRQGAFRWMNRWLKGEAREVREPASPRRKPQELQVVRSRPLDARNDVIHESFVRAAKLDLPTTPAVARAWWEGKAPELREALRERSFRGWPSRPPALAVRPAGDVRHDGVRVRAFDYVSEEGWPLRLWLVTATAVDRPSRTIVEALDEKGWGELVGDLGPSFRDVLFAGLNRHPRPYPARDEARFSQMRRSLEAYKWGLAFVAPRGVGPTRWGDFMRGSRPNEVHVRRRFVLLGHTLDGARVWDVRRGLACLREVPALKGAPVFLQGKGEMAGIALYAGLFEPGVSEFDLWHPPASHRQGPIFLNVLRTLDLPQAVALALPRKVRLHVKDEEAAKAWDWPVRLQRALGGENVQVRVVGP